MPIGRGQFASLLKPDLWRVYVETGREKPLEYPQFFNVDDMPWNPVDDRQISGLGTLQSMNEGDQFTLDDPILGGTVQYEAEIFGLAAEITFPMWKDDQYGVMREIIAELARSSRNKQEVEAWSVLNNAFDNSFPGFDGLSLCNTAHTLLDTSAGTVANRPSPDVGLSTLAIQNALIRFENMVDERNLPRLLTPTMALVSPTNKFLAREVLGSAGKPFTMDNEQNALLHDDLSWMVVHYFTNATQWILAAAQGVHDLQFLWRDRPIFDVFDDPWTKNAVATVWQRHTKGFGAWRGIDGSQP
jgi:hypothetical protein